MKTDLPQVTSLYCSDSDHFLYDNFQTLVETELNIENLNSNSVCDRIERTRNLLKLAAEVVEQKILPERCLSCKQLYELEQVMYNTVYRFI
jgi:hypothetical protein